MSAGPGFDRPQPFREKGFEWLTVILRALNGRLEEWKMGRLDGMQTLSGTLSMSSRMNHA